MYETCKAFFRASSDLLPVSGSLNDKRFTNDLFNHNMDDLTL